MKLEEIRKELKAIETKEEEAKAKVRKDLEDAKEKLASTTEQIEETFNTGDTTKGQQLIKTKLELEEKINYLETFTSKRAELQLITNEDANKYVNDIYKNVNDKHNEVVNKLRKVLKELAPILEDAKNENEEAKNLVNYIYKNLVKNTTASYQEDYNKTGLYHAYKTFETSLKNRGV